jgi:DNA-binding XRE family transcriptional regulator
MAFYVQSILRTLYNQCTNTAMKLSQWMLDNGMDDAAFGALVQADRVTISRIRRGRNRPSWTLADRIQTATHGAVTANDFLAADLTTESVAS